MAYSNGIITAPVSIDDVKQALGVGSNDLGTLCKSVKINMWSRKKPVIFNQLFPALDSDWWLSTEGNCGIVASSLQSIEAVISAIDNNTITINYMRPSGGTLSPYRISDFIGYNSAAAFPFDQPSDKQYIKGGDNIFYVPIDSSTKQDSVSLNNLGFVVGKYSLVIFKRILDSDVQFFTSDLPSDGNSVESVTVDMTLLSGEYDVYFGFSTLKKSEMGGATLPLFYALPLGKANYNVLNYPVDININTYYTTYVEGGNCVVNPRFSYHNLLNESVTITNVTVTYKHFSNANGDLETGEAQTVIGDKTLIANQESNQKALGLNVTSEVGMHDFIRVSYSYNGNTYVFESAVTL